MATHTEIPVVDREPWLFRAGRTMARFGIRGGHRLIIAATKMGHLNKIVQYRLGNGVNLLVPLYRTDSQYNRADVLRYEAGLIGQLVARINNFSGETVLFDCGADIGMVTASLLARGARLTGITAFEPNSEAHKILARNCAAFPVPATALHCAVSRVSGRGKLMLPENDGSSHAAFIVLNPAGDIEVKRIDDLETRAGKNVVIKIDVEGGELDVIEGAAQTLADAKAFVVCAEAHRTVFERSGIDPCAVVRRLAAIRPCSAEVSEEPGRPLDFQRPFFEQFNARKVYNVVVWSEGENRSSYQH